MANELLQSVALGPNEALMTVALSLFMSDLDSQRASSYSEGFGWIEMRCCSCADALMRYAAAAEADASFYTVAKHNFDLFHLYKRQDLEACILAWMARGACGRHAERRDGVARALPWPHLGQRQPMAVSNCQYHLPHRYDAKRQSPLLLWQRHRMFRKHFAS